MRIVALLDVPATVLLQALVADSNQE